MRFLLAALLIVTLPAAARKPNILFILVDDLGWADVGYQNPKVTQTPRIDQLAEEGIIFSNAYAATVCTPSRGEILTGRSPASLKLTAHIPGVGFESYYKKKQAQGDLWEAEMIDHLPLDEVTIAEALKEGGYATGFFGKWHLAGQGSRRTKDGIVNEAWHPQHQGFDVNKGGCAYGQPAAKAYFPPYQNGELPDGPDGEYLTDRLAQETITFITENRETPFLAYLSFYTIHSPLNPKPSVTKKNKNRYNGMLACMDEAVANVLAALDELDLSEDTIVVFTSDNGGTRAQPPLRGSKGTIYEGGVRVPLIYRWPEHFTAGSTIATPVAGADFFPTLLALAEVPVPKKTKPLDGASYLSLLTKEGEFKDRPIYQHFPHHRTGKFFQGASTVRDGDWKLIWRQHQDTFELYNLREDLSEKNNLAAAQPDRIAPLKEKLFSWLEKTDANMPRRKSTIE
ncbi:MAG: sulfatase [Roseibacillus sp.]